MRNYVTSINPFFDLFFNGIKSNKYDYIMDTDLLDKDDHYEMIINLPNVSKENIKISLEDGYLTVEATMNNAESNDDSYIFRERTYGSYSRSYYLGEDIKMEDVSAKLKDGVLTLDIKKQTEEEYNKNHYINIQ